MKAFAPYFSPDPGSFSNTKVKTLRANCLHLLVLLEHGPHEEGPTTGAGCLSPQSSFRGQSFEVAAVIESGLVKRPRTFVELHVIFVIYR